MSKYHGLANIDIHNPNNCSLIITINVLSQHPSAIQNIVMVVKINSKISSMYLWSIDIFFFLFVVLTVCHNQQIYKLVFHHNLHSLACQCIQNDTTTYLLLTPKLFYFDINPPGVQRARNALLWSLKRGEQKILACYDNHIHRN